MSCTSGDAKARLRVGLSCSEMPCSEMQDASPACSHWRGHGPKAAKGVVRLGPCRTTQGKEKPNVPHKDLVK